MSLPIEINGLIKRYGSKVALNDITLRVEAPKIIGLIGSNGAGKTSLLKTCAGLLRPTAGELRVWGEPPFDNLRVLYRLVFIGEETQYDERLKLKEIMELGAIYYQDWDQTLAGKLLNRFELDPALRYKSLSLGMKTQFKVIMGLASRVPLVLFDEPTLGMDAAARKEFYHALINEYSEYPRTFMLSSHLPGEVENLIEEVIILKEGSVVVQKPLDQLQEYAIRLHGKKADVELLLGQKQVLFRECFGGNLTAVIVNDLGGKADLHFTHERVQVHKVSFQDLCIYLTQRGKEGCRDDETDD